MRGVMRRAKIVSYSLLGVVLMVGLFLAGFLIYLDRDQSINFADKLPEKLNACGRELSEANFEYRALHSWLNSNKTGWKNHPASIAPSYVFRGQDITINVRDGAVIINFKNGKQYQQVIWLGDTHAIMGDCN
jgi:hypothetical protein